MEWLNKHSMHAITNQSPSSTSQLYFKTIYKYRTFHHLFYGDLMTHFVKEKYSVNFLITWPFVKAVIVSSSHFCSSFAFSVASRRNLKQGLLQKWSICWLLYRERKRVYRRTRFRFYSSTLATLWGLAWNSQSTVAWTQKSSGNCPCSRVFSTKGIQLWSERNQDTTR